MNLVDNTVEFAYVRYHLDGEFHCVFVHLFDNFVMLDSYWVEYIMEVLLLVVHVGKREMISGSFQNVVTGSTDF